MDSKVKVVDSSVRFGFPRPKFPFYHVVVTVEPESTEFEVNQVKVNESQIRDFQIFRDETEVYDKVVEAEQENEIVVRADWENKGFYTVEISGEEISDGEAVELETLEAQAPDYGGYWDTNWKYYAGAVVAEKVGVERHREPVHLSMGVYKDRISNPDEVRVVGVDPETGKQQGVPCQVYGFDEWEVSRLIEQEPFRYQPTTTVDMVFFADLPSNSEKVYLFFYGNPEAGKPDYETDFIVGKDSGRQVVENDFYNMKLHKESGFIDEVNIKQGVNSSLDHHMEPPGTVHWNPGCYAPPRIWSHASDWDPPASTASVDGQLFAMRKYWGKMPFDVKQVSASVTYSFYAFTPYVIISTALRVDEEIAVKALRNGEFVFKKELFDKFVWKDRAGKQGRLKLSEARPHPSPAVRLSPNPAWLALVDEERNYGFGGISLSYMNERFGGGLARTTQPHFYVEVGPWVYWCRPLVNTFVTNNPQRLIPLPRGSMYFERNAYLAFRVNSEEKENFGMLDRYTKRLNNPLEILELNMDTDERVPEKWVQGIISEEFQELPPDEVFHPDRDN